MRLQFAIVAISTQLGSEFGCCPPFPDIDLNIILLHYIALYLEVLYPQTIHVHRIFHEMNMGYPHSNHSFISNHSKRFGKQLTTAACHKPDHLA